MNTEDKVKKIVHEKHNEKPTLDYKIKEYDLKSDKKWELIKDIIAMLNSKDALNEDKFIILGIEDKQLYVKGLEKDITDDNEYQNLFEYIEPRPKIETGQVFLKDDLLIGYIFIDKDNDDRPYTIAKDNEKYIKGSSFIRRGSINVSLDNETREKMIMNNFIKKSRVSENYQQKLDQNAVISELIYRDPKSEGENRVDPSNNNGKFIIGERSFEFEIKFQVASSNIARIYNDHGILVARLKNKSSLFDNHQEINFNELDFSSRARDFRDNDLAVIINKFGYYAILVFIYIGAESHGDESDLLEFKWKII